MINQIINFVQQHHESTASRAVYRRMLGSYRALLIAMRCLSCGIV